MAALEAAWVVRAANRATEPKERLNGAKAPEGVCLKDFFAYMPMHNYIYAPTRSTWPASSVDARLPTVTIDELDKNGDPIKLRASTWLDRFRPVEQMVWVPGLPLTIPGRLLLDGGWINHPGVTCFNLYHPPIIVPGDPNQAEPWVTHVKHVYPAEAQHIFNWLAHRVQHPADKINHALVLGGGPGVGKDTLLDPIKYAVGPWNFQEVSPPQILGRFNGFLKAVILRLSEARDLGEFDRFQLYEHMKAYIAAPPDVLRIDEKNLREYPIVNCCGIVITTNHKTDGIYLPADDRRHYVAWSDCTKEDDWFQNDYWNRLWAWYLNGGREHVTAFLLQRDLSGFDPKAPPPKTAAFWAIADANRAPEVSEMSDLIEELGSPAAISLSRLQCQAKGDLFDWIKDRKNRRIIPYRLENCGYVPVRNPDAKDGLWKIHGKRQAVYAQAALAVSDQIQAARLLQF